MKSRYVLVAAALVAVAGAAIAAEAVAQSNGGVVQYVRNGKTIDKITCRDFLGTEDKFKPETLSYAIGYGQKGHPQDAVVDVGGINRFVPVVVQSYTAHPTDSLMAHLATMGHR